MAEPDTSPPPPPEDDISDILAQYREDEKPDDISDIISKYAGNAAPSWGDVPLSAVKNLPTSAYNFGHDLIQPFTDLPATAKSVYAIGHGALQKLGIASGEEDIGAANAVGQFLVDRYGSVDAIKHTLATDPVGVASDLSMVLTGGAGAAARVPGLAGKTTAIVGAAGRAIDPLSAAAKGIVATRVPELIGKGAAHLVGDLGTHTGAESLKIAAKTGYEGGEAGKVFRENLRGIAPMEDAVEDSRRAVSAMGEARGQAYRSGMIDISKDRSILNFDKIDDALTRISRVATFGSKQLSPSTQVIRQKIGEVIRDWKMEDPARYRTPEGFDALKQTLGDILDATEYKSREWRVANDVYHAVRNTIVDQTPAYAKVMSDYERASNLIREIDRTLTKPGASVDTALRRLQSVLRNNVNTNYGYRAKLVDQLEAAGAPHLKAALAGQALSAATPRGLGKLAMSQAAVTAAGHGAAVAAGHAALGAVGLGVGNLVALPFMSPRLMGEAAHNAGIAARWGKHVLLPHVPLRAGEQTTFQAGRSPETLRTYGEGYAEGGEVTNTGDELVMPPAGPLTGATARVRDAINDVLRIYGGELSREETPSPLHGFGDKLAYGAMLPGSVMQGSGPVRTEEDQFRQDQLRQAADDWAIKTGTSMALDPLPGLVNVARGLPVGSTTAFGSGAGGGAAGTRKARRDLRSGAEIIADNERKYFAEQQAKADAKAAGSRTQSAPTYEDNVRAITTSRQALVDHANKYGLTDSQVETLLHDLMDYRPLSTKMFGEFKKLRNAKAHGGRAEAVKPSKAQTHYRLGNKSRRCEICTMFRAPHTCTAIAGKISKIGLCDLFERKRAYAEGGEVTETDELLPVAEPDTPPVALIEADEAQAAREAAAAVVARAARPAGGRREGPPVALRDAEGRTQAASVADQMARGFGDLLTTPGNIAKGTVPATPSEEDQFRANQAAEKAYEWGPGMGLQTVLGGVPGAKLGTIGIGGGKLTQPSGRPSVPPFYSAVEKTVDNINLPKAPPEQWLGTIRNSPGVKAEELEWLGLPEWLKQQKGTVSKEAVQDFLRGNKFDVQEVMKGESGGKTKFGSYQLPGGENYRELVLTLPRGEGAQFKRSQFTNSHWDEPNVLAHVRFNDRVIDGKKTLFLEEIQSDWHQKGRKQGYESPQRVEQSQAISKQLEELNKQWNTTPEAQRGALMEQMNALHEQRSALLREHPVPDAPFKTTWPELSLKRMINYAAENGYDQIAWTPGSVQNKRYNLSNRLKELSYDKVAKDTYKIAGVLKDGDGFNHPDLVTAAELPGVVGQEMANKIIRGEGERFRGHPSTMGTFQGIDLEVGGAGMEGFYDKMLPAAANKLGKPHGARVEKGQVSTRPVPSYEAFVQQQMRAWPETPQEQLPAIYENLKNGEFGRQSVHTLPITPALREHALGKGFPLFVGGKSVVPVPDANRDDRRARGGRADAVQFLARMRAAMGGQRRNAERKRAYAEGGEVIETDDTMTDADAAQAAREAAALRMARAARPAGGRQEGPPVALRDAEGRTQAAYFADQMVRGTVDQLTTPGVLARGITPETPGQWSEEDQFRADKAAEKASEWGHGMALQKMLAGVLAAKPGTLGMAGGKMAISPKRSPFVGPKRSSDVLEHVPETAPAPDLSLAAPYVINPQRVYKPGVYQDPRVLAREAEAMVAPEHPALKALFGVTRDDLAQIGQQGARPGNMEPKIWQPGKPGGSYVADNISTPANAQRMIDAIAEARKSAPELTKGMGAWYVMDPAFHHMVKLYGGDVPRAIQEYNRFNRTMTPFSASSDVMTEINRGTVARMLEDRGRLKEMEIYGVMPLEKRGPDFPGDLRDLVPHPYNETQLTPVQRYLQSGEYGYGNDTVKIPLYTQASGVPATGFQTRLPVPDAHFARAAGAPDVRRGKTGIGDYMSGAEYRSFGPWYRENVARPLGIEAVPSQGIQWGLYAPQTGVETAIGAPKLELISQRIWERAKKLGVAPHWLRDQVLLGKEHAVLPFMLGAGAAGLGSLARQDEEGLAGLEHH